MNPRRRTFAWTFVAVLLGSAATTARAQPGPDAAPPVTPAPTPTPPSGATQTVSPMSTMTENDVGDDEQARAHFRVGRAHYAAGRFEEAANDFQEAYALSGRPALLYNAYVAWRDANQPARAADALRRYLAESEHVADRVNLEARLRSLEEAAARQSSANDDVAQQDRGGESAPTPGAEAVRPASNDGGSMVPWIVMGAGGALLAAGAITGVLAIGKESDIADQCANDTCPAGFDLEGERGDARTLVTITDVLLAAGVAAVGTGFAFWLLSDEAEEEEPIAGSTIASAICGPSGCAASVKVSF